MKTQVSFQQKFLGLFVFSSFHVFEMKLKHYSEIILYVTFNYTENYLRWLSKTEVIYTYISICCIMKLCGSYILLIYLISFSILKAEALNSLKFMYWIIKITNFTRLYKGPLNLHPLSLNSFLLESLII